MGKVKIKKNVKALKKVKTLKKVKVVKVVKNKIKRRKVSSKPKISRKGIVSNQPKADKNTFLNVASELLDTLNVEAKKDKKIDGYITKIKNNKNINKEERKAWLKNIKVMRDYYLQSITNEIAYKCRLKTLTNLIHTSEIKTITFPMGKNHGQLLNHLVDSLREHNPPYDAILSIKDKDGIAVGTLDITSVVALDI